tara:strand:+ start:177 stop:650 length:474 start_codon:yes stop_codon:yes gene_type:complete
MKNKKILLVEDIMKYQQNRYPLLFVDKIIELTPGKSATGIKNFSYNEWFFPAHFEDEPNVPGFIQIECLVQTFLMTFLSLKQYKGLKTNFFDLNNTKFRRKIIPGDTLKIKSKLNFIKRGLAKGSSIGSVNDEFACSADFVITVPDVFNKFKPRIKK